MALRVHVDDQFSDLSFSAVSKLIVARSGALFGIFWRLQELHMFAPLQDENFNCMPFPFPLLTSAARLLLKALSVCRAPRCFVDLNKFCKMGADIAGHRLNFATIHNKLTKFSNYWSHLVLLRSRMELV